MPRQDLIAIRRGTAAQWTSANPTLSSGEQGFETDTNKLKIGDGSTAWNSLAYITGHGCSSLEYQTEITANTTLDGSQKGLNKVYPVNSSSDVQITVTTGDYVENDVINIERRGQGTVEIIADTGVRIRGVRDVDNRFFINDPNSMVALLCRGSEEFGIIGNLTRGYTGAVTTSSYSLLKENDENIDVTVIGTGFSDNMTVSVSANATLNSFTVVSSTELTLNLDAIGVEDDTVTVTFDNGDIFTDTDAITIAPDGETFQDYKTWYKLEETSGTTAVDEAGNNNGTISGGVTINSTGKVNKAYSFDGVDGVLTIPSPLGITSFPFTVQFWVYLPSLTFYKRILTSNSPNGYSGINIRINFGVIDILLGKGLSNDLPSNRRSHTTGSELSATTWHQITIVATDINTVSIYVDGSTVSTTPSGTADTCQFTLPHTIAKDTKDSEFDEFLIDELKSWDRALTTLEIVDIYTLENAGNSML